MDIKAESRAATELYKQIEAGILVNYLFFWSHRSPQDGSISKACLSQWFDSAFEVNGICYQTAEHYMMAEKARLFGDSDFHDRVLKAASPDAAKKLGRCIRGFNEEIWNKHRSEIVVAGNMAKFSQNPRLKSFLLSTGSFVLVEASPRDAIWGIGLAEGDPLAIDPAKWKGLNLLGFALMDVRAQLVE